MPPSMDSSTIFSVRHLETFIRTACLEDEGNGDITSLATIAAHQQGVAHCMVKQPCVLAGVDVATKIFHTIDPFVKIEWHRQDGDFITEESCVGIIEGNLRTILRLERLMLNCMQRMSGIASLTRQLVQCIQDYSCELLDTRKTTPNFRVCEKLAVKIGGGSLHRWGLDDALLIKDNHMKACGGLNKALKACLSWLSEHAIEVPLIVEVSTQEELDQVIKYKEVTRVLLDNVPSVRMASMVNSVAKKKPLEASGGITPQNILDYAATGVDYISMGAITHQAQSVDMSLSVV